MKYAIAVIVLMAGTLSAQQVKPALSQPKQVAPAAQKEVKPALPAESTSKVDPYKGLLLSASQSSPCGGLSPTPVYKDGVCTITAPFVVSGIPDAVCTLTVKSDLSATFAIANADGRMTLGTDPQIVCTWRVK